MHHILSRGMPMAKLTANIGSFGVSIEQHKLLKKYAEEELNIIYSSLFGIWCH